MANLTDEEMAKLKATKNEQEWNAVCDEIKGARNGCYPPDWYPRVIIDGVADRVSASWASGSAGIRITTFPKS